MKVKINDTETISITEHSGKMIMIPSISTDKLLNDNCRTMMNSSDQNCICKYCYVDKTFKMYKQLEPALIRNHNILTKRVLNDDEIKNIAMIFSNTAIVRFESFGDLNNEIQLINYVNIARACKYTRFALFTKHFNVVLNYFKTGARFPKNITLVLSSPIMDYTLNETLVNTFKKYHSRVITFTVTKNKNNSNINCGKRKCINCRNCYDSPHPHDVIELVK